VLYFFRRKLNINETVRTHIIKELYWYRGPQTGIVPGVKDDPNFDISTGKRALSHSIYWLNVYSLLDPISAKLIFYENTYEYGLWFNQHMGYWHEPKFYKEVLLALQGKNKKAKPPKYFHLSIFLTKPTAELLKTATQSLTPHEVGLWCLDRSTHPYDQKGHPVLKYLKNSCFSMGMNL